MPLVMMLEVFIPTAATESSIAAVTVCISRIFFETLSTGCLRQWNVRHRLRSNNTIAGSCSAVSGRYRGRYRHLVGTCIILRKLRRDDNRRCAIQCISFVLLMLQCRKYFITAWQPSGESSCCMLILVWCRRADARIQCILFRRIKSLFRGRQLSGNFGEIIWKKPDVLAAGLGSLAIINF